MSVEFTPSYIANVAPEFSGITQEKIDLFRELVGMFICKSKFGTKGDAAELYFLLHMLTMSGKEGIAGEVTSEKVGELQRNYGSSSDPKDGDLGKTSYGLMFKRLRRGILITPLVV